MAENIRHQGVVESINGSHMQVRIIQTSACASCSIKGHCTSADTKEKLIDVMDVHAAAYKPGDSVWVVGALSMGMQAVCLAFVVPLIILVVVLFVLMHLYGDELVAAGGALACAALYDLWLWLNKSKLKKKFSFTVQPIND